MDEQTQSLGQSPETPIFSPNLSVGSIISNGILFGFHNFFPLIGALILWVITIWIPYLNVGTTIGLYALVVKMSRVEKFSPVEIFDRSYRQIFPEFFILLFIMNGAIFLGYVFFLIPGLILSIAWCISIFLLIDKKIGILESLKSSNKATYGFKWTIFGGLIIILLIFIVILFVIHLLFSTQITSLFEGYGFDEPFTYTETKLSPIGKILFIVFGLIFFTIYWGAYAHIYRELSNRA
ncbi:MAG: YciC family protein [Candidatus Kapaibacteriales bacterium]